MEIRMALFVLNKINAVVQVASPDGRDG
jgi:hypothetical protein